MCFVFCFIACTLPGLLFYVLVVRDRENTILELHLFHGTSSPFAVSLILLVAYTLHKHFPKLDFCQTEKFSKTTQLRHF